MTKLPSPPAIRVQIARDAGPDAKVSGGFMDLRRLELVATYPGGQVSEPFPYDIATRRALDAVVVVAHFPDANGERHVYLRSAVRPPVVLRHLPPFDAGSLWEVPAGLIEPDEDPREAAARELAEELGIAVARDDLHELGPFTYPAPAVIGERHVYFHVEVREGARGVPTEDGSPLEREASVVSLSLAEALDLVRRGELRDAKTETALRRLAELP